MHLVLLYLPGIPSLSTLHGTFALSPGIVRCGGEEAVVRLGRAQQYGPLFAPVILLSWVRLARGPYSEGRPGGDLLAYYGFERAATLSWRLYVQVMGNFKRAATPPRASTF